MIVVMALLALFFIAHGFYVAKSCGGHAGSFAARGDRLGVTIAVVGVVFGSVETGIGAFLFASLL